MAVALNTAELVVSTISFEVLEIDFILDLQSSIYETRRRYVEDAFRNLDDKVYLDGSISCRNNPSHSATYVLIPGQDAGPFHVLLPRFLRAIQTAPSADLSNTVLRGQLSAAIRRYVGEFHGLGGNTSVESTLRLLQNRLIAQSHLGRMCFYLHRDEFLLEVEKLSSPIETFAEVVSPSELTSVLIEMSNRFRSAVLDGLSREPTLAK